MTSLQRLQKFQADGGSEACCAMDRKYTWPGCGQVTTRHKPLGCVRTSGQQSTNKPPVPLLETLVPTQRDLQPATVHGYSAHYTLVQEVPDVVMEKKIAAFRLEPGMGCRMELYLVQTNSPRTRKPNQSLEYITSSWPLLNLNVGKCVWKQKKSRRNFIL